MSSNEIDCPKCGVRLKTTVRGMGVPGGLDREEGHCPICGELVISEMTDGFVYVDLVQTGGLTITNSLTGKPFENTPDGISLAGVTFSNEQAATKFISLHWPAPVITKDVPAK